MRFVVVALAVAFIFSSVAEAQETITYSYDSLGRMTGANKSGGPNNQTQTTIDYDPAGNRTRYRVSGSAQSQGNDPGSGAGTRSDPVFVVVPLNGFTVIPVS